MIVKRTLIAALLVALAAPALTGCAAAVATGAATGVLAVLDRRTFGAQTEDEGIEWKLFGYVGSTYDDRTHVNQTSFNRRLLLSGEVPDEQTRAAIEAYARGLANVRHIWNELRIAPATSLQSRSNDAFITSKIKGRFVDARKFRATLVKVVTENRTAYLFGIVTRAEADAAIEIARTTSGVLKVVSLMEIITPEQARQMDTPQSSQPPPDAGDAPPPR
ncbi:MAG: BON domain-containing protein [Azospira sp.]|jgi:osmotically-inducible protein OsmY|nr:BON domain-containing protein [Azospira sp.]